MLTSVKSCLRICAYCCADDTTICTTTYHNVVSTISRARTDAGFGLILSCFLCANALFAVSKRQYPKIVTYCILRIFDIVVIRLCRFSTPIGGFRCNYIPLRGKAPYLALSVSAKPLNA